MSTTTRDVAPTIRTAPLTRGRLFFVVMSAAILVAVLVGFSPTFYLRAFFEAPPLPFYIYLHGGLLTAWFVIFFAQTCLVAAHRTMWHRRLGVFGVIIAASIVPLNALVVFRSVPRFLAAGMSQSHIAAATIGDLASLLLFAGLVAAAVRLRRRPDAHKRLMLLASITFTGPVVSRLMTMGVPLSSPTPVFVGALVALALYDLVTRKTLHEATMWGSVAVIAGIMLSTTVASKASDAVVAAFLPARAVESVGPVFHVASVRTSVEWYRTVLGFSSFAMADIAEPPAAIVTRDGVQIFLQRAQAPVAQPEATKDDPFNGWPARRLDAYLRVPDARAFHEIVRARVEEVEPIVRTSYGCLEFALRDPDGHVIIAGECP